MTAGPGNPGERMVRAKDVAAKLGVNPRTVRRRAIAGELPYKRLGKLYLFDAAWYDALPAGTKAA